MATDLALSPPASSVAAVDSSDAPPGLRPPSASTLSARLDQEWGRLCRRPGVDAAIAAWDVLPAGAPPLRGLDDLLQRSGYRGRPSPEADDLLRRLVERAAHDTLAARVVLQRILPGLLGIVRAEQRRCAAVDAFDVLLAEAWLSIINYPTATRPTDVAARLLHDARHRAFTNPRRRRRLVETPLPPERLAEAADPDDRSPFEELTTVLRGARDAGLPERDIEVMAGIVNHGSSARFATVLQLDQRSVRYRRDRAIERVRAAVREHRLLPVGPRPSRLAPGGAS